MIEYSVLPKTDTSYLDKILFDDEGNLKIFPSFFYERINYTHLRLWCHTHGIYCLPTEELIFWLQLQIKGKNAIEIGAGNGAVGRALKIPITDACLMRKPEVALHYKLMGQPITKYPTDIISLDAVSAVKSFKPDVAIGCWVTHKYRQSEHWRGGNKWGIEEELILRRVEKYIVVGHEEIHANKPIMDLPHETLSFPWLWSRSGKPDGNRIFIWSKNARY